MNDQEIQAALLQISKMEEAAKAGHFSILQVELAELQNQLDWITRRDHLSKNSYYKITPKKVQIDYNGFPNKPTENSNLSNKEFDNIMPIKPSNLINNKPHCWGKMNWILEYKNGEEPKHAICSCEYGAYKCKTLTRENATAHGLHKGT